MGTIKVVWLCHLCNADLNEQFNMQKSGVAPWMTSFIDIARSIPGLELHVVSPNLYTNKDECFSSNGISFHLYKYCSGLLSSRNSSIEIALRKGKNIEQKIKSIINDIKPDVVHMFGAENIDYSEGILTLYKSYPTLITYQGFIRWAPVPQNLIKRFVQFFRIKKETEIYDKCSNVTFFSCEDYVRKEFEKMFPGKNILRLDYPQQIPHYDATKIEKEYDLVYWGRVTKNKGIEDFIRAIAILKERKPDIRAIVMGGTSEQYHDVLKALVDELGVGNNIDYKGFVLSFDDVFKTACKARVYCLPTYFDAVPGTITEAMFLKLPVVTYPVGGIPFLNEKKECLALAEERNVQSLADNIWALINDDIYRRKLINNAYERVTELCDNNAIPGQILECYNKLLGR